MEEQSTNRTLRAIIQRLENLERAGVAQISRRGRRKANAPVPEAQVPTSNTQTPGSAFRVPRSTLERRPSSPPATLFTEAAPPSLSLEERTDALYLLRAEVVPCTRCQELACTRTQTVFGVGSPTARLCFVGEAPGADEDAQGEPFVGRAGQLLTKIIEACKLRREDVYICNVLKCRPPNNRTPLPDEMANCRPFLERQLEIIRPEFICCLGAIAAKALLNTDRGIGKLRGQFHNYNGIPVLCTYHPAYLLRNPAAKKDVWEDMKLLMAKMGVEL